MATEGKAIFFASSNQHKIAEMRELFAVFLPKYQLLSIADLHLSALAVKETGKTYQENALLKAQAYLPLVAPLPVLVDDSGVEVAALPGLLGIKSHRFYPGSDYQRCVHLLSLLKDKSDRRLIYQAVLCHLSPGEQPFFASGTLEGVASWQPSAKKAFGYDSIMIPHGHEQTLQQLGQQVKNSISHRANAVKQLAIYLKKK